MDKNFEKSLPEGYKEIYCVDATNKKLITILMVGNIVITTAIIFIAAFIIKPQNFFRSIRPGTAFIFAGVLLAYIVLHELVHGIAYKVLTKEKLTYGFTLTVAYCGVPNIYVYRRAALIALLAPFTVFSIIFLAVIVFALHIRGCIGDLYDTFLFLTKLKTREYS